MNRGVYSAASGGMAALARLEQVSQNLANVHTAGYKASRVLFRVRPLDDGSRGVVDPVLGRTSAQVAEVATVRDFSQGAVRTSGNPLDVAIDGEGFFVVTTPRGERYTRQGTFSRDAEGYLVTAHGERVQGDGGDVRLGDGEAAIASDGTVSANGLSVGRLKVVSFGDRPPLVPEGSTLFAPLPGAAPTPLGADATRLEPGAIEAANATRSPA